MRRYWRWIGTLWLSAAAAWAQTSQPAESPKTWEQTVQVLADALVNSSERDRLAAVLPPGTAVRRFDRLDPEDRLSLRETTGGAVVVASLSYTSSPTTMATDLANSLRDAEFVPEAIRNEFMPDGDAPSKGANETAAHWISTTLQPGVEQPVGVVVLWQQRAPRTPSEQPTGLLIFVLVKGQPVSATEHRITQVIYGDTRQIMR